jgi:hypothetical protein
MVRNRTRRTIIAAISGIAWLGYMGIGLALINQFLPTVAGEGPVGLAAFVGLVWGVVTVGLAQWAASD